MKKIFSFLLLAIICNPAYSQWSVIEGQNDKSAPHYLLHNFTQQEWNSSNFASEKELEWFRDARYGMLICFGPSTYKGQDLSWGICKEAKAPDSGHGQYTIDEWSKWSEEHMSLEGFDADEWIDIAKKSGMKYVVVVAKHHDGFHLWDTEFSDFKITNTPFGRDYLKEISDACHKAGMKFGIYYSQRDWYHPDYAPIDTTTINRIPEAPYYTAKPGKKIQAEPKHAKYIEYQKNVVRELCTKYGKVDIFWFDASYWGGMFTAEMWDSENLTRIIRDLQPGIIINNRTSVPGDFDTPEQRIGMYQYPRPWESCMTLTGTWSWSTNGKPRSVNQLLHILISTASGSGNTLMSWGPKWDGSYEDSQIERLEELGDWLKEYGQSIYGTEGGPWITDKWGSSTYKDKKAYLFIDVTKNSTISLPAIDNKITKMKCLTGEDVNFEQNNNAVIVKIKANASNKNLTVVEVTFKDNIKVIATKKKSHSIFNDHNTYGQVIFQKENLTSSSKIDPSVIIDLKESVLVTGISLNNVKSKLQNPDISYVKISKDGKTWIDIETKKGVYNNWEVPVTRFSAGIKLTGVSCRYIKIGINSKTKINININKMSVYSK